MSFYDLEFNDTKGNTIPMREYAGRVTPIADFLAGI